MRIKKLTDYTYSPTNPASEDAIRAQIDDAIQEVYDASSRNDATVNITGNQSIAGVKTFSSSPIVPDPTTDMQVANKKGVDVVQANLSTHKTSTDHDGRYYTESEVNALLLANQQGNHSGTWQGLTPTFAEPGIAGVVAEHTRQISDLALNVKDFGAVGNGIADDTTAIQATINAASLNEKSVYIPNGTYLVSSALLIPTKLKIFGESSIDTVLKTNENITILKLNGTIATRNNYNEVSHLQINGNDLASIGLEFSYTTQSIINNCIIVNCEIGVYSGLECWSNGMSQCIVNSNLDDNIVLTQSSNDWTISDCQISEAGNFGLHITENCASINLIGCLLEKNGKEAIMLNAGQSINIFGCYLENNNYNSNANTNNITIKGDVTLVRGVTISACQLFSLNASDCIGIDSASGVSIIGGEFGLNGGGITTNFLSTTINTTDVYVLGIYGSNVLPNNDLGKCVVNFKEPIFKGSGGVYSDFPTWTLNAKEIAKPPTFRLSVADSVKYAETLAGNAIYFQHYNTSTSLLENYMQVDNTNRTIYLKPLVITSGTTAQRPGFPIVAQTYFDTTLSKPIWCKVAGGTPTWVDATGATV